MQDVPQRTYLCWSYLYKNEKKHAASQNKLKNCIESYKDLVTMGLSLYETNRVETWDDETKFSKSENLLLKSGGIVIKRRHCWRYRWLLASS